MELYANVFNKSKIYQTLFLKIFTVSEYCNVEEFKKAEPDKYEIWKEKYFSEEYGDEDVRYLNTTALFPEYAKIVGITLCTVSGDETELKRNFQNYYNVDSEVEVLRYIIELLEEGLSDLDSPLLCGHNIIGYDIPFIIKRAIKHGLEIPSILKKTINSKPWESLAIDTMNLWKFGSYELRCLNEITMLLGLKYKSLPEDEFIMNMKFHSEDNYDGYKKETMNRVNLILQLFNKFRNM